MQADRDLRFVDGLPEYVVGLIRGDAKTRPRIEDDAAQVEIVDSAQPRLSAVFSSGEIKVEGLGLPDLFQIRDRLLSLRSDAFEGVPTDNIHVSVRSAGGTEI